MEKVRVMIVDDSRVSRAMIKGHLAKTNFEVCAEAKTVAEAVEMFSEMRPQIITMDMNLPDADGIECSRRIHLIDPSVKIVMISAMKDASLMASGREVGISSFLQKPISTNELIETMMVLCQSEVGKIAVLRESYAKAFVKALQQGIYTMIGIHAEVSLEVDERRFLDVNGIAVIVGLTGYPTGRAILHMDFATMQKYAHLMLGLDENEELSDEEAADSVEEAVNIIIGRGASNVNDVFKDRTLRITPPGTISGNNIRIASPKLTTFKITAETKIGNVNLSVGFAEGE
jgi:DNA-binding response OmpR family regulator